MRCAARPSRGFGGDGVIRRPASATAPRRQDGWTSGNQARLRRLAAVPGLQAKLAVGDTGDPLERQADAAADKVMRMADPGPLSPSPSVLTRKCADCEDEAKGSLQREAATVSPAVLREAPDQVHDILATPGRPLEPATHDFMSSRFGADFSDVRVHDDASAAASAAAVQARAYTVGRHVVFGRGQYDPAAEGGRHLLAHELAHTIQQRHGGPAPLRRACGPAAIGASAGCATAASTFVEGPIFRFLINCDDWAPGAEAGLGGFARTVAPGAAVDLDGYASVDGPEPFNLALACARVSKAKAVLVAAGIDEARIHAASHGPTPGPAADRRSVVVRARAENNPAPPSPAPETNQKQPAPVPTTADPPPKTAPNPPALTTPDPQGATPSGGGGSAPTGPSAAAPEEHPRLTLQIPVAPSAGQIPLVSFKGLQLNQPRGTRSTALDQVYQPNIAIGLNYAFTPTDTGFQLGIFAQGGLNVAPLTGNDRPTKTDGDHTSFTGLNVQGYLQPSYVIFSINGNALAILLQPGIGRTFAASVPGVNGLAATVQGGFQYTHDFIPNRLQFFGALTIGGTWAKPDAAHGEDSKWQDPQKFIGFSIGLQPIVPLINYPSTDK